MDKENIFYKILLILLTVSLLLVFFFPINDPDFGWHYRCGEQILTQFQPCLANNFSYFLPGYQWAYSGFFYDLSLAWVFDLFGFVGVSILGSIIFTTIFLLFYFLMKAPSALGIAAVFCTIFLSQDSFSLGYRSQIFGLLFFVLTLLILRKVDSAGNVFSRYVYLLPILLFFWANSHLSFFLGLLIFGIFLGEKIVRILLYKQYSSYLLVKYFFIFLFSMLVVCINPFGWRIYQEVINHFGAPLNTMIAEWVGPADWHKVLIIFSALITTLLCINYKKIDYRFFLLLIFACFAISARRNLPIYYLMLFYVLSDFFNYPSFYLKKITRFLNILAIIGLTVIIIRGLPNISQTKIFSTNLETYCQNNILNLPCKAVEKISDKTGNVFNMYEWGGFLIWQAPKVKVFVDGRMSAWQDERGRYPYAVFLDIIQTKPGWNEELKKYKTDYLLIGNGSFLDLLLQEDTRKVYGWQEEYRDKISAIYYQIKD